jgi:uncharacterized protein YacL
MDEVLLTRLLWLLVALILMWLSVRILPTVFMQVKDWFEKFIAKTIADVINNFWEEQSKRLQDSRKQKNKKKSKEHEKKMKDNLSDGILLDTSVLIDGRIIDIVKTGFITSPLVIPKVVLNELHLISDNEDTLKRLKGRRGLDIIAKLKDSTKVIIFNGNAKDAEVDKELINIAKKFRIRLMTMDFNLNKVASVSGVKVLNLNELVNAVKTVVLPGEMLNVKIVQEGKEKEQGVGYMPDGTMVVVEGAKSLVGNTIETKVARVIQTNAGKMIFCSLSS